MDGRIYGSRLRYCRSATGKALEQANKEIHNRRFRVPRFTEAHGNVFFMGVELLMIDPLPNQILGSKQEIKLSLDFVRLKVERE